MIRIKKINNKTCKIAIKANKIRMKIKQIPMHKSKKINKTKIKIKKKNKTNNRNKIIKINSMKKMND